MEEQHQQGNPRQGRRQQGQTGSGQYDTPLLQQHGPPEPAVILARDGVHERSNGDNPATAAAAAVAPMQDGVSPEVFFAENSSTSVDSSCEDHSPEDRLIADHPEQEHNEDEAILDEAPRHLVMVDIQQEQEEDILFDMNAMAHAVQQRGEHTIPGDVVSDEEIRVYLETGIWQHEEATEDDCFEPLQRMSNEDKTYVGWFMLALIEQTEEWVDGVLRLLTTLSRSGTGGSSPDHSKLPPQ